VRDVYVIGSAMVVGGVLWAFGLFVVRSFRAYTEAMRR
jgi:hypothetical protein